MSAPDSPNDGPRQRLLHQLDRMVESGRVTPDEAAELRTAGDDPEQFDAVIHAIRQRHAGPKLDAAVEAGEMTEAEAAAHLAALGEGEHDPALRAQLRHHPGGSG